MSETENTPAPVLRTARERARAEIHREILAAARRHLATEGASSLSVRAIARELGMVSSAVYRYVASRDDLLTQLIVEAYNALGAAAETREEAIDRCDFVGRFAAVCTAVREWALANPHEYALIYGTPVPGYDAPTETVAPAGRVSLLLARIVVEAALEQRVPAAIGEDAVPLPVHAALQPLRAVFPADVSDALIQRGVMVWTGLFGTVSFELFGQFRTVIGEGPGEREAFFAECVRRWALQSGIGVFAPDRSPEVEPV
jgi:AcrR family transcriptional regulator